ncbi:MAG: thioredoxin [Candidatus Pacebacteria bacterium]|jgi:thioredoxin 1|nr:thioredoxin [Candidatus Paceibacterota bacterium]MDD2757094.1 thioredoxin [Candidatus Paceibacterota bacterium]MDD3283714.1 thioredoxin [Candidatus Paceibacterota bacterium]MDD3969811.1 thioredoxin [Candidatus Paceibacterota bacterium]MDD4737777.1 thioredoxin [Candidatus Paceibacterota bacterium]
MNILNDDKFQEVISSGKPVLLDVYTQWCPPCKILGPILENLEEEYDDKVDFYKMDLDQNPITGNTFGIDRIPTVMLFVNGEVKSFFVGLKDVEEIRSWINKNI